MRRPPFNFTHGTVEIWCFGERCEQVPESLPLQCKVIFPEAQTAHVCGVDGAIGGPRGRLKPNNANLWWRISALQVGKNTPQHLRSFGWCRAKGPACPSQDGDCVHYSAGGSFAAGSGTPSTFMSLSVYRGRQIKDVSHFRGCKRASGDGSDVSDTPNPPSAASTYRLPIHVSSKATLQISRIIKCPHPCYPSKPKISRHPSRTVCFLFSGNLPFLVRGCWMWQKY